MKKIVILAVSLVFGFCVLSCSAKKVIINDEMRPATIDVLLSHGLNGIDVNYDMVKLESLETDTEYTYLEALDIAIESFLTDDSGQNSPLSIVSNSINSYKGNVSVQKQNLDKLKDLINTGGSLCMPDIDGSSDSCLHAEEGEDVEKNWIFLLQIPEMSDYMFWSIVSKDGKSEVYNYGFN